MSHPAKGATDVRGGGVVQDGGEGVPELPPSLPHGLYLSLYDAPSLPISLFLTLPVSLCHFRMGEKGFRTKVVKKRTAFLVNASHHTNAVLLLATPNFVVDFAARK